RLHAQRWGSPGTPLVICVPGVSANMRSFDFIGQRLGSEWLQAVALDLRGRGQSEVTPAGSYGWSSHASDIVDVVDALGAERCSVIGHSMGGAVALQAACQDGGRLERIVLVDVCGHPEPSTLPLIDAAISRLGTVYPSVEAYLAQVQKIGTVSPWS